MTESPEAKILRFVQSRPDGTTCPSEIARSIAEDNNLPLGWRQYMAIVHDAVDGLIARGQIKLTWKSIEMTRREGPYRISAPKQSAGD